VVLVESAVAVEAAGVDAEVARAHAIALGRWQAAKAARSARIRMRRAEARRKASMRARARDMAVTRTTTNRASIASPVTCANRAHMKHAETVSSKQTLHANLAPLKANRAASRSPSTLAKAVATAAERIVQPAKADARALGPATPVSMKAASRDRSVNHASRVKVVGRMKHVSRGRNVNLANPGNLASPGKNVSLAKPGNLASRGKNVSLANRENPVNPAKSVSLVNPESPVSPARSAKPASPGSHVSLAKQRLSRPTLTGTPWRISNHRVA
jgi:hypothetical protein